MGCATVDHVHQMLGGGYVIAAVDLGGRFAMLLASPGKATQVALGAPTREVHYTWDLDAAARMAADEVARPWEPKR